MKNRDGNVTNTAEIETWRQRDVDARTYMYATIKTEQQCSLHGCQTAHSMWTRIQAEYAQVAADNEHLFTAKFFNYKYQSGHSVMAHVAAIEQIAAQLRDLNAPISEIQLMSKILLTLPPSFRHFLSAWDSVPAAERTIKLLTSRLIKEEIRTKQYNDGGSDPADIAFFAGNSNQQQPSTSVQQEQAYSAPNTRGRGGRGGRRGQRGGYRGNRGGNRGNKGSYEHGVMCEYCHKYGHSSAICRKRIRDEREKKSEEQSNTETGYLSAICFTARRSFDWYADSGATKHMTDQKSILLNFVPIEHEEWIVSGIGGTQLIVRGQGDIKIISSVDGVKHHGTRIFKNPI